MILKPPPLEEPRLDRYAPESSISLARRHFWETHLERERPHPPWAKHTEQWLAQNLPAIGNWVLGTRQELPPPPRPPQLALIPSHHVGMGPLWEGTRHVGYS